MRIFTFIFLSPFLIVACNDQDVVYDASGVFEADETIISAEAVGQLMAFNVEEGQLLDVNEYLGYIDTTSLHLKKRQLQAQINALLSKKPNIAAQTAPLQEQLQTAKKEMERTQHLMRAGAATPKQLDDANAQVDMLTKQVAAQLSSLTITSENLLQEIVPLQVQIEQVNDQIKNSVIINPIKGTVLTTYAEENEITASGKPLYRIADLSFIILKAYITGDQLTRAKPGQEVTVLIGAGEEHYKRYKGTVTWISDKAEFTPKTIQTMDERANLVYAIKIKVKNDGMLKMGMYAEVKL